MVKVQKQQAYYSRYLHQVQEEGRQSKASNREAVEALNYHQQQVATVLCLGVMAVVVV